VTLASAIILLFLVIDPFGNVPFFVAALKDVDPGRRRTVIIRELLISGNDKTYCYVDRAIVQYFETHPVSFVRGSTTKMREPSDRKGPLTDIRLVELGQLIAGPFCGQLMADMGADVIKVEPPGQGDPMRVWGRGDYPLWWQICARNKRVVTANLREEEGQELVRKLISQADMVLENFRPGTMERWGLSYEELANDNPGLIMIRVSGYGQTGPYSKRAGYASIGEAMGGMRYLCGEPDRQPSRAGLSIGDSLAAMNACIGALAALHHREKTGEGQVIDASIFESVLSVMEATVPEYTVSNYIRERSGATLPNVAPSNIYDCKDGIFLIAANQDTVFRRLCKTMGKPELADDERFSKHTARGANMAELDGIISAWTGAKTIAEVDELMQEAGVPAGGIYRAPEMLEDPQYKAREAIIDTPTTEWPNLKMQNVFPKMSKTQGEVRWPGATELGAHNNEVYGELLGLSSEELAALQKKSVI
jgi:crotonobetainyl-CoA:carnitine CoA-transferase CaiB-like acyl-CoA transferase